ncbi:armadillo repeat-containing X-linked protein 5 isoform X1 [Dipodomys spectabilis]|uniref:armadillo repeat-containing X-linked protein 5 isoform X1 n=1 Tax=Dipodomys spectabilis TaxID=105255 RepID=UPI001C543C15|nr:armadillo repeat-containing X-linked protein 5 isoform X1 [Dipodomys spectabilis]XP_042544111.1 armadillo repeat-containing X-linked protein 5 isoform X1 [Dipodomys spectabilis]XP_042544112.1 armadillo repeat-containing X-linked protein 5 isoform X1 [Dipodomys spectabilis]
MIGSTASARAAEEAEIDLKLEISSPDYTKVKAMTQAKTALEAEPTIELVTHTKICDGTMAMTQTVTYTQPVAVTIEVSQVEDVTNIRVVTETSSDVMPQTKSMVIPVSKANANSETKSEIKVDAGKEAKANDKADTDCISNIEEEASIQSETKDTGSVVLRSTDEDEENVCSWFWTGEEPSVGSWFWPKEDTPLQVYKPPLKIQEEPKPTPEPVLTLKQKAAAWARARYVVLAPVDARKKSTPPKGNWTLVATLIETPLGIRPLTKIPPYDGPYYQTLAEIKEQVKQKENYGPSPKNCRCNPRGFSLEPEEFDKLVDLLKLTTDPFIHEIATMIMGVSRAYPFTQDIIHDVGITVMIENLVNNPQVEEHSKALAIISENPEPLEEANIDGPYIREICKEISANSLNSHLQLTALKLLVGTSMRFENHHLIASHIPDFLILLNKGSFRIKFYALRLLYCLSKNQANVREMITGDVLSTLVTFFNKNESKVNILNTLQILENINFHFKKRAKLFTKEEFTKSELISIFQEAKLLGQKLQDLAENSDPEDASSGSGEALGHPQEDSWLSPLFSKTMDICGKCGFKGTQAYSALINSLTTIGHQIYYFL